MHIRSATAFLYLFPSLGSPQSAGFVYTLQSTIPIGAGLGSSASVSVCLSTALLLQIRTLAGPHPDQPLKEAELILSAIGQLTTSALELISSANFDGDDTYDAIERLGTLICMNHGLLDALGVSHPCLERVREFVDHAGIGWTKLTGAGDGGCAMTLLRPDINEETVEELERKFIAEGFQKYEAILGADGVGVLWSAVFRNGPDGENGEEIDQENFENAVGAQGIEQLVGVGRALRGASLDTGVWHRTIGSDASAPRRTRVRNIA
ncbi:hypothetical protein DL769_010546 [Monosporascus sp. CRB-8-3]|nr:hypothetical protein DL769_010546 [Monosporascus sp. CRB-8-3]